MRRRAVVFARGLCFLFLDLVAGLPGFGCVFDRRECELGGRRIQEQNSGKPLVLLYGCLLAWIALKDSCQWRDRCLRRQSLHHSVVRLLLPRGIASSLH